MTVSERARAAVEARLAQVMRTLGAIEGVSIERRGDAVRVRGRGLMRRSIEDVRLRFAGRGR